MEERETRVRGFETRPRPPGPGKAGGLRSPASPQNGRAARRGAPPGPAGSWHPGRHPRKALPCADLWLACGSHPRPPVGPDTAPLPRIPLRAKMEPPSRSPLWTLFGEMEGQ